LSANLRHSPPLQGLDRLHTAVHHFRDLINRQPGNNPQRKDITLLGRKYLERLSDLVRNPEYGDSTRLRTVLPAVKSLIGENSPQTSIRIAALNKMALVRNGKHEGAE
jgi:hypothetical protein